ncbi:MAG: hypothetical protein Q9163_005745 [Psora crenata]
MATAGDPEKYEILETIGRGSFGTIRKVRRKADGHVRTQTGSQIPFTNASKVLCRKEIQYIKMSQKEREQLHAEFSILNSLKHPNIVGYYHREHLKSTQELYLYMEYCGGGDLSKEIQKLKDRNHYADEEYVWSIFAQLVAALYRCHYGVDAPEVGRGFGSGGLKPMGLKGKNAVMILHRDLKPENVFLSADNSVKLGDFGLSKLMQSHDFASTYVGTPFYMSPEICAAEKYTLHSDIWSLGCVIYELCARTQPFHAKTHFHLIQKIKEGRLDPLPSLYSQELQNVIKSCLNVNPLKRPDTASLLSLPAVRLIRKEREIVELGRILRDKEEHARLKVQEAEATASRFHNEKEHVRAELEAILRREWEVKAGLEISRQVQLEKDRLNKIFEAEVQVRVEAELERKLRTHKKENMPPSPRPDSNLSSVSTCAEDFPSTTDLSSLSLDSPADEARPEIRSKTPPQRRARGPLARARTQFESPKDIQMVDPSPMSIACLSLSPRRTEAAQATSIPNSRNIFANVARTRLQPQSLSPRASMIAEDDEDTVPDLPSPTRPSSYLADPFKAMARPGLLRQKTAPTKRLGPYRPSLFPPTGIEGQSRVPSPPSPKHSGFSPVRRAPPKPCTGGIENDMYKAVMQRNLLGQNSGGGRTLVELAQARAGIPNQVQRVEKEDFDGVERKENLAGGEENAPLWDPEKDEMPSPFLIRGGRGVRRL